MPGLGRAISDTCDGEKEKCEAGWGGGGRGYHAKTFQARLRPIMSDHLVQSYKAVVLVCF